MFKKEIIWREILFEARVNEKYDFQQKDLAKEFSFSLSTVFNALKKARAIKAVKVGGRGFYLLNYQKLLYLWAVERNLEKDIVYETYVPEMPDKIEAMMPSEIFWGLFSAYKFKFKQSPSDYDKVYVYANEETLKEIKKRFPQKKGPKNLIVLGADKFAKQYGSFLTLEQMFVDIWNVEDWYAQEFLKYLNNQFHETILAQ